MNTILYYWQHIYIELNPVAFKIFSLPIHWYGIMYVLALFSALLFAKWIVKKDNIPISQDMLDNYFIWAEIGVILGARLGYIIFYDPDRLYYLLNPWQIFNPFKNGEFVGIRGMSYHGAFLGFLIASYLFAKRYKFKFWLLMDLVSISVPVGYIFGRIGNFLNQELYGRITDVPWGIYVAGVLRHPSQIYEAILEGLLIFIIIFAFRKRARFVGQIALFYAFLYGLARFVAEFFREPDPQLGFICCGWLTMGQLLSLGMILVSLILYPIVRKKDTLSSSS